MYKNALIQGHTKELNPIPAQIGSHIKLCHNKLDILNHFLLYFLKEQQRMAQKLVPLNFAPHFLWAVP